MYVLFETAAGFAIFKLLDEKKLEHVDSISNLFQDVDKARNLIKLTHFEKFADVTEGLVASTAIIEGKIPKSLKHALKKSILKDANPSLLVADTKLGSALKEKFNLQCLSNTAIGELMRGIRSQLDSLLVGTAQQELSVMRPSLALSLSRYKLKFSPDKVDTMVIQAVCLLDDLDKELNNYIMRCREWYGWHFPELGKIITDNITYAKAVKALGTRDNAACIDLSDILPDEIEEKVKDAAETSMGTEIAEDDMFNICSLCEQIIELSNYRSELYDYLQRRMMAIAPNLTVLVGELVGGRLISHAGSLINLAKHPASTIQLLGAEKALFRALKTKKDTPKYGLIYHSQLVGQSSQKLKGKMSRMLAAKTALAIRVDALGDDTNLNLGVEHRAKLENRLKQLEEGNIRRISGTGKAKAKFEKYHGGNESSQYHAAADSTLGAKKRKWEDDKTAISAQIDEIKQEMEEPSTVEPSTSSSGKKKKSKKEKVEISNDIKAEDEAGPPKKKVKHLIEEINVEAEVTEEATPEKKKKKKSKEIKEESVEVQEEITIEKKKKKKSKKAKSESE